MYDTVHRALINMYDTVHRALINRYTHNCSAQHKSKDFEPCLLTVYAHALVRAVGHLSLHVLKCFRVEYVSPQH